MSECSRAAHYLTVAKLAKNLVLNGCQVYVGNNREVGRRIPYAGTYHFICGGLQMITRRLSTAASCRGKGRNPVQQLNIHSHRRNERGIQLVELLVAMVLAAFFSLALYDSLALGMRATTTAKKNLIAANIAQQVLDDARNQSWASLIALPASTSLPINGSLSSTTMGANPSRPLLVNTDLNYHSASVAADSGFDNATCVRTISSPSANTRRIVVTVSWNDAGGAIKTHSVQTNISVNGIHNY